MGTASIDPLIVRLAALDPFERTAVLDRLSADELRDLAWDWKARARPDQLPPDGEWGVWIMLAGRGAGKTRAGAEWVREQIKQGCRRVALVAPTAADSRDVMVEGESGILSVCPPWELDPRGYEPSKRRVTFANGAIATTYSADEPDRLRGPQHDAAWADEIATWRRPEAWDMLLMGLRLGRDPRAVVTTTPRPSKLVRGLLDSPATVVTRASTYANRDHLAESFYSQVVAKYEGTRLGRQEIHAELLTDVPGALWTLDAIEAARVKEAPDMARIVVAIDPAVTSGDDADETGLVVAAKGVDGDGYVLDDLTCRLSPDGWARRAVEAYHTHKADRIVAETNNGGDLVERVIRTVDPKVSYRAVHASRGKRTRAEPVAALYEQGRVHHVGLQPALEDQMCAYVPDAYQGSPDRVDALVWALTELMLPEQTPVVRVSRPVSRRLGSRQW